MSFVKSGVFIVIDGIDGCGKTLHSKSLCRELRGRKYDAVYTKEPSYSFIGKFIREKILYGRKVAPEIEALLFAADRYYHVKFEILDLLKSRKIVVSDRYLYASLAYQGAQNVSLDWIREVNRFSIKPDLAIYLDVPAEVGLARIKWRKSVLERIELERKVREIFLKLTEAGELVLIDATRPIDEVKRDVLSLALKTINSKLQI
jgi:dTMP kinase